MRRSRSAGFLVLLCLNTVAVVDVRVSDVWARGSAGARPAKHDGAKFRGDDSAPGAATPGEPSEAVLEARRRWDEGLEAAKDGNFELAVAAFRQSYTVYPHVETLRNLALAELEVGDFVQSATHLSKYLSESTELLPREREGLERELSSTERMVARLDLDVTPENAVLLVDGVRVEPPIAGRPLYLSPGRHEIHASLGESRSVNESVDLGAGRYLPLRLSLDEDPRARSGKAGASRGGASVEDSLSSRDDEVWPVSKRWAVVCGGVLTAASLGVAAYGEATLAAAGGDVDDARADLAIGSGSTYPCAAPTGEVARKCQELRDAEDEERRAARISNIGFITAGILGVATAATWLLWPDEQPERRARAVPGASPSFGLQTTPWVTVTGVGWLMLGSF